MIGQTISHYKILEKLPSTEFILSEVERLRTGPSTEFIPSSSSGRLNEVEGLRTSPSTGLRTGGEGGNLSRKPAIEEIQ